MTEILTPKILTEVEAENLLKILEDRFHNNMYLHEEALWQNVLAKVSSHPNKLWSLYQMENTGGEPDIISYNKEKNEYIFCDTSKESPIGRRSLCYDQKALDDRKNNKPLGSAVGFAKEWGIELLSEEQYRNLQKLINCDIKTSSWLQTPENIRKLGGGIFGDWRFGRVFVYHNGVESYYASRGFRGLLKL